MCIYIHVNSYTNTYMYINVYIYLPLLSPCFLPVDH